MYQMTCNVVQRICSEMIKKPVFSCGAALLSPVTQDQHNSQYGATKGDDFRKMFSRLFKEIRAFIFNFS